MSNAQVLLREPEYRGGRKSSVGLELPGAYSYSTSCGEDLAWNTPCSGLDSVNGAGYCQVGSRSQLFEASRTVGRAGNEYPKLEVEI